MDVYYIPFPRAEANRRNEKPACATFPRPLPSRTMRNPRPPIKPVTEKATITFVRDSLKKIQK